VVTAPKPQTCECDSRWTCTRCSATHCPDCDGEFSESITLEDEAGSSKRADYCLDCAQAIIKEYAPEIAEYVSRVRITDRVEKYDPRYRSAPTREEYDAGFREAYTENAVRAHNRHTRTNYDELIRGLDRSDALEQAVYNAVRERVEELLDEALLDEEEVDEEEAPSSSE